MAVLTRVTQHLCGNGRHASSGGTEPAHRDRWTLDEGWRAAFQRCLGVHESQVGGNVELDTQAVGAGTCSPVPDLPLRGAIKCQDAEGARVTQSPATCAAQSAGAGPGAGLSPLSTCSAPVPERASPRTGPGDTRVPPAKSVFSVLIPQSPAGHIDFHGPGRKAAMNPGRLRPHQPGT